MTRYMRRSVREETGWCSRRLWSKRGRRPSRTWSEKGDRPLCPLNRRFGRWRDCGLGQSGLSPFSDQIRDLDDLFLNRVLDQLRFVVDVELAHQVELVGFDGLYAQVQ